MEFRLPSFDTVIEIHEIVFELDGGLEGVPHPEYIHASLGRPQSYMMYDDGCDIHLVAAIVLHSFVRNHAFADGNKRTALLTTLFTYNGNSKHLGGKRLSYGKNANKELEALVLKVAGKNPPEISEIREELEEIIERIKA